MDREIVRKLQKVQVEILDEIVNVCEKYELTYFLIGGTLLGAIRHKGFIPWDDDLDIAMPRADYEKFIATSEYELNEKYWLHWNSTDPNYWLPFAKVKKKGTVFEERNSENISSDKGIFVDVFPLDNSKKEKSILQSVQAYLCKKISTIILWKRGFYTSKPKITLRVILKLLDKISIFEISNFQQKLMASVKNEGSAYFVNLGSNYNYTKQTIPKEKYYPPCKIEFEGRLYSAPNDWDYILTRIYGDYMELPPINKRITHNPVELKFEHNDKILFEK